MSKFPGTTRQLAIRYTLASIGLFSLGFWPAISSALDYTLNAFTEVEYDDNAARFAINERSELRTAVGADLGVQHESQQTLVDLAYSVEYSDYDSNRLEDNTLFIGSGNLLWRPSPDRFEWSLHHDRRDRLSDLRERDIQDNRETREVVTTGPRFIAKLSKVDRVSLAVKYSDISFKGADNTAIAESDGDSERQLASLNWSHAVSNVTNFGVGYNFSTTEYDNDSPDLDVQQYFVTYASQLASGEYSIYLGGNSAKREGQSTVDGPLAQVNWLREFGEQSVSARFVHQISDSSVGIGIDGQAIQELNRAVETTNAINQDDFDSFDVIDTLEQTSANITYNNNGLCNVCRLRIGYGYDKKDFETLTTRNKENDAYSARFAYDVNSQLTTSVFVNYQPVEYKDAAVKRDDENYRSGIQATWSASERLSVLSTITYTERKSNLDENEFESLASMVSLNYRVR